MRCGGSVRQRCGFTSLETLDTVALALQNRDMTTTRNAASETFDAMTSREDWLGYGYLGARNHALDNTDPGSPAQTLTVEAADQRIIDWADAHGWTDDDLFNWANSKNGRWFGDIMFGGTGIVAERFDNAVRARVMSLR